MGECSKEKKQSQGESREERRSAQEALQTCSATKKKKERKREKETSSGTYGSETANSFDGVGVVLLAAGARPADKPEGVARCQEVAVLGVNAGRDRPFFMYIGLRRIAAGL